MPIVFKLAIDLEGDPAQRADEVAELLERTAKQLRENKTWPGAGVVNAAGRPVGGWAFVKAPMSIGPAYPGTPFCRQTDSGLFQQICDNCGGCTERESRLEHCPYCGHKHGDRVLNPGGEDANDA